MEILKKNEVKILELYRKNLFLKASIRTLMQLTNSKSYQRIHEATNNLLKNNILKKEDLGNTNLITINLERNTILLLSLLEEKDAKKIPNKEILETIKYLTLITGSYAKKTNTKQSDLDVVVITNNEENIVRTQKLIENQTMLLTPKTHIHVIKKSDFMEMLEEPGQNFGKETVKNKIIIKNAETYYELIKKAVENGYKN